jgi:amino acid adenylation domain-containing protein
MVTRAPLRSPIDPGELTAAESLIWIGQQLDPESTLYNMALAVDVAGALDVDALGAALQRVVDGDEVLRTTYPDVGGSPERRVLTDLRVDLELLDLPTDEVPAAEVNRVLAARTERALPLDRPLFDVCVVRRSSDQFILYANHHHVATDAWSMGVFFTRWAEMYAAVESGRELPSVPSAGATHPDFSAHVLREREARASSKLAHALEYWGDTPADPSAAPPFYGVSGVGDGRVVKVPVPFGAERSAQLARLAAEPPFRSLTAEQSRYQVFATLLLAWHHRVSDRAAVSIGSPWHNRMSADARATLGLFVELFPLRAQIEEGETFASLGARVARGMMTNMRHVFPGASAAPGARGFPLVLNYITARVSDFAGFPAHTRWLRPDFIDPDHRARLHIHDFDGVGEPSLDLDLAEAVFDESAQEWAVRDLLRLFDAFVEDPARVIDHVPLVLPGEAREFATVGRDLPQPPLVGVSLHRVAGASPAAPALIDGDDRYTYGELLDAVAELSARLSGAGLRRGDVVGLALDRSADLVVALLAVLDAGGAFLPLDPSHPEDRVAFMVAESGAALVLCRPDDAERFVSMGAAPVVVGSLDDAPEPGARPGIGRGDVERTRVEPDDLAYVIYTSGSTGRPKGVEVTHGSLAEYVDWARRTYTDRAGLRFPLFTSPSFDMTLTSIFVPLVSGGTIVVYREEPGFEGLLVRRVFEEDAVDVVKLSPSHLVLVRDLDLTSSGIERLVLGGEDLKTTVARAALDAFGGDVDILNEYGPTEATVGCMIHRFDPLTDTGASVPIGVPADNVGIHVLDPAGRHVPRGVKGEICVSGPRVARGYLNRPEETDRAFGGTPGQEGRPLYRTGDVGRWRADGTLEFLGRADDQVKLRGVRIELGEIDAALSTHPDVQEQVAVLVRVADRGDTHCVRCGLEGAHPEAQLGVSGVCAPCRRFERDRERVAAYFGSLTDLEDRLRWARERATGTYDTLMLYSGGKDSTYALCRIVDLGARPLVFMMDNGFISDEAKRNARKVVDRLGLELVMGGTPAMPEIFAESLARFSDVCDGCFKVIYTLAMNLAVDRGIPAIVTGLSRGQIFQTRLADLYRRGIFDPVEVDRTIHEARKVYHRMDDAVSRNLDVAIFDDDRALDDVKFIDFYRYTDVALDELYAYLGERTPWIRPGDTGRSTNCLINEAGIFVHRAERGFHNYTLPYSWDVRLGHKERDTALAELDDDLDPARIRRMLDEVGYRERTAPPPEPRLVAYFVSDRDISHAELRAFLGERLPADMVPTRFVRLDGLPLTPHGKIDRSALAPPDAERPRLDTTFVAPTTPVEESLVEIWSDVLGLRSIGVRDDFFELGGDSMQCIQIVAAAGARDLVFAPRDLFANPTVESLARRVRRGEARTAPAPASASATELAELERELGL